MSKKDKKAQEIDKKKLDEELKKFESEIKDLKIKDEPVSKDFFGNQQKFNIFPAEKK